MNGGPAGMYIKSNVVVPTDKLYQIEPTSLASCTARADSIVFHEVCASVGDEDARDRQIDVYERCDVEDAACARMCDSEERVKVRSVYATDSWEKASAGAIGGTLASAAQSPVLRQLASTALSIPAAAVGINPAIVKDVVNVVADEAGVVGQEMRVRPPNGAAYSRSQPASGVPQNYAQAAGQQALAYLLAQSQALPQYVPQYQMLQQYPPPYPPPYAQGAAYAYAQPPPSSAQAAPPYPIPPALMPYIFYPGQVPSSPTSAG